MTLPNHTDYTPRGDTNEKNMSMLLSSPILQESTECRNVLNDLHEVQLERSRKLYRPFSSPIRGDETDYTSQILSSPIKYSNAAYGYRNQEFPNGHQGMINNRNKHNKLRITRKQYKQDKILLQRNRTFELQTKEDTENQYNQDIDQLNLDIDTLIEEERDLDAVSDAGYDACIEEYENEMDDYELQQELEMVELMSQLELVESGLGQNPIGI